MASPLPPDPYIALGVAKDATQAAIKTAHRKLVLKCHPDKVGDPDAKQAASDQFHKIQTAYEILVDQDRRERYDAQVRLAELKKEKMERYGGGPRGAERTAPSPYKSSHESVPRSAYAYWESERVAPQTEERRPAYAKEYFDLPPRASVRKEPDYERTTRRAGHDSPKPKSRPSTRDAKESERERRREKTRKAERDTQRDRDRKYNAVVEEESGSNSDEYERRSRRVREEEDEAAAARKARDAYYEQASRQQREAEHGHFDERTRKMFAARAEAWDYIRSSQGRQRPETERRPSPVRQASSKDKFDYVKRKDGRPVVVSRRPSERPKAATRDSDSSRRTAMREPERERRSSAEILEDYRKVPSLSQSRSSPADIQIPTDKPRAQSVQMDSGSAEIPKVRRAETMPYDAPYRVENVAPPKPAGSRDTEFRDGLATPATTPEYTGQAAANAAKHRYGRQYADDFEHPTPDGYRTNASDAYRTEVREPVASTRPTFTRRVTRSPSPVKDYRETRDARDSWEARDKLRSASARYASSAQAPPPNNRTTSYVYTPGQGVEARASNSRGMSPRDPLYGEIPARAKYSPYTSGDEARYERPVRPEDIRVQSGYSYSKRASGERPAASRGGSGNPIYTSIPTA